MGDHRASIIISFEIHGKKYKVDTWINYNGFDGVDRRVIEFFELSWDDAFYRYSEEGRKAEEKREKIELEKKEKAEYERLKNKFENKIKVTISAEDLKETK